METRIIFHNDYKTGEVFDFTRLKEILENLPEGALREKLVSNLNSCEKTIMRILRNTSKRIYQSLLTEGNENGREVYWVNVGPDGRGIDSLSFYFGFNYDNGKRAEEGPIKRDMNGGIIFHGAYRLFNEDLTVKSDVNWNDETIASISIHT